MTDLNVNAEYLETIIAAYEGLASVDDVVDQLKGEERIRAEGYARAHKQHDKAAAAGYYTSTKTGKWALSALVSAYAARLEQAREGPPPWSG